MAVPSEACRIAAFASRPSACGAIASDKLAE